MKRVLIALLFIGLMSPVVVLAGGIVTNSNQSAAYVRMLARDASTSIDAVYFNPAGLTKLEDGIHLSFSNQSIFQKKTIENKFPLLHDGKYIGDVAAPLFPDFYAVYKKNKLALAFGLTPNAGGGSAKYNTGLPSFEIPVSVIPTLLNTSVPSLPTDNYSADINFEGTSVFWGAQVNASYAINDMISLSVGARMILAKNTYDGYLKNIMINPNYPAFNMGGRVYTGSMVSATQFFADGQTYLNGVSGQLSGTASSLQPIITGGGGGILLSNGTTAGLTPTQVATLQGTITALGGNPTGMTIAQSQAFFSGASTTYAGKAATMGGYAAKTADVSVDADQTGTGYTPILGANFSFGKFNVGLRYEFKTKLTLKNKTKADGTTLFKDGLTFRNDIPAILSVGVDYKAMEKMRLSAGLHYYFDKNATFEYFVANNTPTPDKKTKVIEGNLYEIALGGEYDITDKILISAGYLYAKTGVGQGYQTDLSHSLTSNTVGFGGGIKVTEKMLLNLGMLYTMYTSDSKSIDYTSYGVPSAQETYNRTNVVFSFGVDYRF